MSVGKIITMVGFNHKITSDLRTWKNGQKAFTKDKYLLIISEREKKSLVN